MGRPKGSTNKTAPKQKKVTAKQRRDLLETALFEVAFEAAAWFRVQNELLAEQKEEIRKQRAFLEEQTKQFFERNKAAIDEKIIESAAADAAAKEALKESQSQETENETVEPADLSKLFSTGTDSK